MANEWPIPAFHFQAKWDGLDFSCRDVSGLDTGARPVAHGNGDTPDLPAIKIPGLKKSGHVTLRKMVVRADHSLRNLLDQIRENTVRRMPATISLVDESGRPTMAWTLANAWPTRMTGVEMKPDGTEALIEAIELAHEGVTLANV